MNSHLDDLNPAQRRAVEAAQGPVLVVAGPGSGKTRVLTHRVAWLIADGGVSPYHILAVTFTNKAAREMMERLFQLLGPAVRQVTIGTFHATCARILRQEGSRTGLGSGFVIYDEDDQVKTMEQAIQELGLEEKRYPPRTLLAAISRAKNELIVPQEYPTHSYWHEVAQRLYARYQELLLANNAVDFDDLLLMTARLFRRDGEALQKYRHRFQHILVDEFQDTNLAQYELVHLLALQHRNLFVVGDEDQSIYSWRGADARNVHRLRSDFPEAQIVLLEQNYRSSQIILDAAQSVIARNPGRVEKRLWTPRQGGSSLVLLEAYNEEEEAQFVLAEIQRLAARGDHQPGDCAVLYRTNAQSRALEDAFLRAGTPYHLVGATRFYARREVKDVVAYLRLIHNPHDALSLLRIINVPKRSIGKKTIETAVSWAAEERISVYEALRRAAADGSGPFDARSRRLVASFVEMMQELIAQARGGRLDLVELFDALLDRTGYAQYVRDGTPEGEERWENVMELRTVASRYIARPLQEALPIWLEEIALVSDVDNLDERVNVPTFLTLHMAKGLEFPVVFIIGLEEGRLPHSRSLGTGPEAVEEETLLYRQAQEDPEALEEERRLFYVGLTRAKDRAYLVYTFRRTLFGRSQVNVPSRFLVDIPAHLFQRPMPSADIRPAIPAPPAKAERRFGPGDKVRHPQFGPGLVMDSRLIGDDEEVTVVFEGIGPKRILASLGKMEKV